MNDASKSLSSGSSPIEFVGFDISDEGFPKAHPPNIKFVVHDMRQPFPKEYLGTFDVLHIRLLIYGMTKEVMPATMDNLIALLSKSSSLHTWNHPSYMRS